MIVRKAERRDAETLFEFVLRLDRDGAPVRGPVMAVEDLVAAGFGPEPLFEAFIAETAEGVPLGAISFFRGYSGWYAKSLAMVHLLFVTEAARGQGIKHRSGRSRYWSPRSTRSVLCRRQWKVTAS